MLTSTIVLRRERLTAPLVDLATIALIERLARSSFNMFDPVKRIQKCQRDFSFVDRALSGNAGCAGRLIIPVLGGLSTECQIDPDAPIGAAHTDEGSREAHGGPSKQAMALFDRLMRTQIKSVG